jgi:hypothetical protein
VGKPSLCQRVAGFVQGTTPPEARNARSEHLESHLQDHTTYQTVAASLGYSLQEFTQQQLLYVTSHHAVVHHENFK